MIGFKTIQQAIFENYEIAHFDRSDDKAKERYFKTKSNVSDDQLLRRPVRYFHDIEIAKVDDDGPEVQLIDLDERNVGDIDANEMQSRTSVNGASSDNRVWPLVRFTNGREILAVPFEFNVLNGKGDVEARRTQIPLILAWALSVHKSQGLTLERVKVDLRRAFENGQGTVYYLARLTRKYLLCIIDYFSICGSFTRYKHGRFAGLEL